MIKDFNPRFDTLKFRGKSFDIELAKGLLESQQFVIGNRAKNVDHRFIYSSQRGQLFFDADGTGPQNSFLITRLENRPNLTFRDIQIF